MALQFILGGSGTGKSALLYQMIVERSVKQPQETILFIVPEQYTMQAQKHIVEAHPCHGVMNVDIISFGRLAYRVFDELGISQKEILEDTGKSMIIRRLLGTHREALHAFRGNIRRRGFVDEVKSLLSELLQYDITPDMLAEKRHELGTRSVLYEKLQDIEVIYREFLQVVHEKYITAEEVPDRLCEVIDQSEWVRHSVIFMDNFNGFTPIQYKLMAHILTLSPLVVMAVTVDGAANPYGRSPMENLFYLTRDTLAHLEEISKLCHVEREKDILLRDGGDGRFGSSRELAYLERQIFRERVTPYEEPVRDIEACQLGEPRSEMQFVAMRIHDYVARSGYRYDEIAVVASDMERYRGAAGYWFERYDIPCFFDGRRSISGNMLVEWMRSLLNMFIQNFSYEAVFRHLRCGLSGAAPKDADRLEDYVLALGIRGFGRWQQTWTIRLRDMTDEDLSVLNGLRQSFVQPLTALYETVRMPDRDTTTLIRAIYRYMQSLGIRKQLAAWQHWFEEKGQLERAKEYEQIYDVMIALLERVHLILGRESLSVRELADVLEAGMTDARVGIIPPGMDQVTFGDIRRSRLDNVRVLFFVGMNDGLVPLVENGGGLLTDMERLELARHKLCLAPTARENTCTEQFYLYANMTKPSEKLILTCSAQDTSGKDMRPSSILDRIRQVFPKLTLRRLLPDADRLPYPDVNQGYDYLIRGLRELSENGRSSEVWREVYDWFYGHPSHKAQTVRLVEAAFYHHWDEALSQAAVAAVYGGQLTGGVTMLERYASCAYAHFLAYGLRLKERQIYQVQAPDIGMIFHQAIELFSRRISHSGYQWRDIPDAVRDQMAEECVNSVVLSYNYAVMQDNMRGRYLTEKILRMTKRTIWVLQEQLKKGDFDPVGYEMRFTTELETDSMRMRYGEQGILSLNGKIDRMDICEDQGRRYLKIIDYKSGSTAFDLAAVYHGLQLQLIVYMNAAQETEQKAHPGQLVIPAGVLYYHIDDPLIETEVFRDFTEDTDGSGETEILNSLSMDGLVVDDRLILQHMDRSPGAAPKVLPISYKKDGTLTAYSSAARPEDFEILSWHVKNRTRQLGHRIFSGDIAVDPYRYGTKKACDFCDYRAVCGFDRDIEGFAYQEIKKLKKQEIWEVLNKEAEGWDLNGPKNSGQ